MELRWARAMTRRRALRAGTAAAAVSAGAALAACASTAAGKSSAAPSVATPVTELSFMPWWIHWDQTGKTLLQEQADTFTQTHPGLRLTALPGPQGGGASTTGVIASILSGTGPDVVGDCCGAWVTYTSQGVFANLTPLMKRDNVPISTWAKAQAAALTTSQGQFGLPIYNGPVVFACRLDILDTLGLSYPDPAWTYKDAADLWTRCTGTFQVNGKSTHRYGANFWWDAQGWYAQSYLLYGFGGAQMDSTRTKCLLNEPGSVAAGNWVYPLLYSKVLGPQTGSLSGGTAAFVTAGGWSIPRNVVNWGSKFKWAYYPVPHWPQGRTTFNNNDFWGLNAQSKNPDAAWEVLKWLTYEDSWQRFCMKVALLAPCKVSLWAEFEAQLQATAPLLVNKGLKWFRDAAEGGYGYPEEFFKYNSSQATNAIGNAMGQIFDQKLAVQAGFAQAANQVNVLEASGATSEVQASKAQALFPAKGPVMAKVQAGL